MSNPFGPKDPPHGVRLSDIEFDPVFWILYLLLARGHITVLSSPDHSVAVALAAYLIARQTTGTPLPNAQATMPAALLYWGATHKVGTEFKRLVVGAGGDETRVIVIGDGRPYDPIHSLPIIRARIDEFAGQVACIVIDMPRRRPGREPECEQSWMDLSKLVRDADMGVLVVCGSTRRQSKLVSDRVADSPLAREASIFLSLADDMDVVFPGTSHHAVMRSKAVICEPSGGYEFFVRRVDVADAMIPVVEQMAPVAGTAEEVFAAIEAPTGEKERDAVLWLRGRLAHGPMMVKELQRFAKEDCIAWRTVRRAQKRTGVCIQTISGHSIWSLAFGPWTFGSGNGPQVAPTAEAPRAMPTSMADAFMQSASTGWPTSQSAFATGPSVPGQAGHAGHFGLAGQVGQWNAQPPESDEAHVDHALFVTVVETAVEIMENSTFTIEDGNPRRLVAVSAIEDHARQWLQREDIIGAVMNRLGDPSF